MRVAKYIILILAIFTSTFNLYSLENIDESEIINKLPSLMGNTNGGKEYLFSIPPLYDAESGGSDNFVRVFVISPVVTNVKVGFGGNYKTYKTPNNGLTVVDVPAESAFPFRYLATNQQPPARVYQGKAIHIIAEEPVVVYVIVRYKYTTDGFLGIPISSLGKDYVVATSPQWGGSSYKLTPWVNVTATFDKTRVTFTMGGGAVQSFTEIDGGSVLETGQSRSWSMNKGETLIFATSSKDKNGSIISGEGQDLTGSRINSSKPVSVVSGHACSQIPIDIKSCDYIAEMEFPTVSWGKNIIVPRIAKRKKAGIIRIFAKEENTVIFRNGVYFTTISKIIGAQGESFDEHRVWPIDKEPEPAVFSSSKPFYIMFYNPGSEDDKIASDPFSMTILPIEQYQNDIYFCTPNVAGGYPINENWLNVIIETDKNGNIPEDFEFGTFATNWQWQKVKNMAGDINNLPNFRMENNPNNPLVHFIQKNILLSSSGVYRLRSNSTKFVSYSYGNGSYESYGYPTINSLKVLDNSQESYKNDKFKPIPTYKIECGQIENNGIVGATVLDPIINNDSSTQSKLLDVWIRTSESYNYNFKIDKAIDYGGTDSVSWSLTKINLNEDSKAVIVFQDIAGNDTTIIIEDFKTKIEFNQNGSFGLQTSNSNVNKVFSFKNTSNKMIKFEDIKLKNSNQGFSILPLKWDINLPFQVGETREIEINFNPKNLPTDKSLFIDTLRIGDSCNFSFSFELSAYTAGNSMILADDWNFGKVNVNYLKNGSAIPSKTIWLSNPSLKSDLVITKLTLDKASPFSATINNPKFKSIEDVTANNPLVIKPNSYIEINLAFSPQTSGTFNSKIVYSSNASGPDNETLLSGIGSQGVLNVNQFDWGNHKINRQNSPVPPKKGTLNGEVVMTFNSIGNDSYDVKKIEIKEISGTANSFLLEDQKTSINDISKNFSTGFSQGEKRSKQIYFSPSEPGVHEIELTFTDDFTPVKTILKGTGTFLDNVEEEIVKNVNIRIAQDVLYITNNNTEILNFKINDLNGKTINSGLLNPINEINLKGYSKQVFFVELSKLNGDVLLNRKFILD